MLEQDIRERVCELVAQRLSRSADQVHPDACFDGELNADPLEVAELFMAIQEEFNIVMTEEATHMATVGDIIRYVAARIYE